MSAPGPSDFAAARSVIAFARKHVNDLDAHLTASQRAQLLAFSVMVESKLDTATAVSTWCEGRGFGEYKKVRRYCSTTVRQQKGVVPWHGGGCRAGRANWGARLACGCGRSSWWMDAHRTG